MRHKLNATHIDAEVMQLTLSAFAMGPLLINPK